MHGGFPKSHRVSFAEGPGAREIAFNFGEAADAVRPWATQILR
jgi:hypothetical protein